MVQARLQQMFVCVTQGAVILQTPGPCASYFLWWFWRCCWSLRCCSAWGGTTKVCSRDLLNVPLFTAASMLPSPAAELGHVSMTTGAKQQTAAVTQSCYVTDALPESCVHAGVAEDVPYADVTFKQEVQPRGIKGRG